MPLGLRHQPTTSSRRNYATDQQCEQQTQRRSVNLISSFSVIPGDIEQPSTPLARQNKHGALPSREGQKIAILGGGITGLTAAYYLTREIPTANITIFEKSGQLGGWLRSKRVEVGDGTVLFEGGPRTLRSNTPAGAVTLEMISSLGLRDELLITPKNSVAAQNRFLYFPDHLVRMPGPGQDLYEMAWGLLTEPVFQGLLPGLIFEYNRPPRDSSLEDESVGEFLERRLGSQHPGNNIVSAVLHGIYAGDINKLSAKSLLQKLWHYEAINGSMAATIYRSFTERSTWMPARDVSLEKEMQEKIDKDFLKSMRLSSVYTFKQGIGTLSNALENSLRSNPNVEFRMNESVTRIEFEEKTDNTKIATTKNQLPSSYNHTISTISGRLLSTLTSEPLESLAEMHAVTVMVVNLFYEETDILPERGFGYLIPRSIPLDQNPECALGVVFDSDSSVGQDTLTGTKVTVMLGGHWWDGFDSYPDEDHALEMAKSVLERHLRIHAAPTAFNVSLQRDCIPQYTVGHEARLKVAHEDLLSRYRGKLTVAGNSYTGVGMNDCVRAGRDAVMDIKEGRRPTGLEQFARAVGWVKVKLPSRPT